MYSVPAVLAAAWESQQLSSQQPLLLPLLMCLVNVLHNVTYELWMVASKTACAAINAIILL